MKKLIYVLLFLPSLLSAQGLDMELLQNMNPRSIGPAGMAGRVTAIDVVTEDPDIIYAGTASGGIWKSTSGGIQWEPIFDKETTASIGALAIQQSNPSVIWAGTGEGNPRNSLNGGDGLYKSLDGGKNWTKIGLEKTRHIHRILINPLDPDVVYVGAIGSPWGVHPDRGLYRTKDGGKTWAKILFTNDRSGIADLVMDPSNPHKLIAAMWEHKRDPWFFKSGGEGSGLYITHDGGDTWEKRGEKEGLPKGELGRIGLAIAPSMPNRIYALVESKKNALYRSEDGGFTWAKINDKSDIGNRPFYYSDIFVDPVNENRVYSIFTYVNVSEDGGKNFSQLMPAYYTERGVHPDHHSWYIHPKDPNFLIDGNDGGLNISRDRGKHWHFVQNIAVAQFYHIAVDDEIPYNVYGGMQDNGSWAGPAYVWKDQSIRNSYWQEISFGDGFDVLPDPTNSRYGISTAQQGYAGIYDRETGYVESIRPTYPDGEVPLRFNWNVGMSRSPFNPKTLYFGSQFVHKSTDGGQTWEIISPDLTTNDPEKQKQGDSGGLTMDATGAENYCTILVIEPSTLERNVLFVGTDDGQVQVTRDGGENWSNVSANLKGMPAGAWITQIKASNKNRGEALLVANDYRRYNYTPYAFRTKDYGKTWERIVDESDVASYALSIVEDPIEQNLLFLGTDDGLYVSVDGAESWTKWSEGFPTTNVMDMVIHPREHDLVLGTFGRAAWILDDIRPLRAIAKEGTEVLSKTLKVFDAPTGYHAASQQPTGSRFGADAMFHGENRPFGLHISYLIHTPEMEEDEANESEDSEASEEEKVSYDSLTFEVFNANNERIRNLKFKAPEDNGLHRYTWNMREDGVRGIRRGESRSGNLPSGVEVVPGTYKVRFHFGDQVDSTSVEVKNDPRLEVTDTELQAKYDALKNLEAKNQLAYTAVERIKEGIKLAEKYHNTLKDRDETAYEAEISMAKEVKDSLNTMLDVFVGKEDKRQGITRNRPNRISSYAGSAAAYIAGGLHAPGETEKKLVAKYERELKVILDQVNAYYATVWPEFRKAMEGIALEEFKDYENID